MNNFNKYLVGISSFILIGHNSFGAKNTNNYDDIIDYYSQTSNTLIVHYNQEKVYEGMTLYKDLTNKIKEASENIEKTKKNWEEKLSAKARALEELRKKGASNEAIRNQEELFNADIKSYQLEIKRMNLNAEATAIALQKNIETVKNEAIAIVCNDIKTAYRNKYNKEASFFAIPRQLVQSDAKTMNKTDITDKIMNIVNTIKVKNEDSYINNSGKR